LTAPAIHASRPGFDRPVRRPELPVGGVVGVAAGVALMVGLIVATTPIGSGDYGQWLMVSRTFVGADVPGYRELSGVPPLVPLAIGSATWLLGDPLSALHAVALGIVILLGAAFYAAGAALNARRFSGLIAVVLALLVTDRYLELFAFGGLPQAAAIGFAMLSVASFGRAVSAPATDQRWWAAGLLAIFATCLTHVPTATISLPASVAAAAIAAVPRGGQAWGPRVRPLLPVAAGFALVGGYWLVAVAPDVGGYVANPASLSYRGPERVLELLADYAPTVAVMAVGALFVVGLLATLLLRGVRPDGGLILIAWLGAAWASYVWAALSGASTDFPRFVPVVLAPLVVAAAGGIAFAGGRLARLAPRVATSERALLAIGLVIIGIAPFSFARFQTEAQGYRLPDYSSLATAAAWADRRLIPGGSILAPVREAKWIEGLTGRSALFSTDVRYAFRPLEWERSLAADAVLRGNLSLANEAFFLTLSGGVASAGREVPRNLLIAANHSGEYVELLRLIPEGSRIVGPDGATVASLPALGQVALDHAATAGAIAATTSWAGARQGANVSYRQTLQLAEGATEFVFQANADTTLPVGGLQVELRPAANAGVLVRPTTTTGAGDVTAVELVFPPLGRSEPRLQMALESGGSIAVSPSGSVVVSGTGPRLTLRVTALTPGGASSGLRLLDPKAVVDEYDVAGVFLHRDPSYDARRGRLELLGFHLGRAEGPYVVMVRDGAAVPEGAS
jgi:hypothetical protein